MATTLLRECRVRFPSRIGIVHGFEGGGLAVISGSSVCCRMAVEDARRVLAVAEGDPSPCLVGHGSQRMSARLEGGCVVLRTEALGSKGEVMVPVGSHFWEDLRAVIEALEPRAARWGRTHRNLFLYPFQRNLFILMI